jgi:periplasmic divalent cation tolerance protein
VKVKMKYIEVLTTCESRDEAQKIAEELVKQRACACVQITGPLLSIYRWKGTVERSQEWRCTVKTRGDLFDRVEEIVKSLHSYEVPEIAALPIVEGSDDYLSWIQEETAD